jgi:biofilm PGA synthesis N-glycosyltransferase PgaC
MNHMLPILLIIALICSSSFIAIYGLYFLLVVKTSKKKEYLWLIQNAFEKHLYSQQLPNVSILVPAYNEGEVISRKLRNIAAFDYPREKIELILIDDCSTDKTFEIAKRTFGELNCPGKIIKNYKRMGVNACYNKGVAESKGDLILMTDADVMIEHDALMKGVKIFSNLKNLGGITGKMVPVSNDLTAAVLIESSYRSFFDSMSMAESAIYSTFPGYTCFTLLKKSAFSPLPLQYGSSDGNISLATIRRGLKFLYVPSILFYEPIAVKVTEQRRQKIRRAARLMQSALANKDMLFKDDYKSFGKIIFPLRLAMMMICPILFFVGLTAMLLGAVYLSITFALFLLFLFSFFTFLGARIKVHKLNVVSSFVVHQFYLLMALFLSQKRVAVWRPAERSEMTVERAENIA